MNPDETVTIKLSEYNHLLKRDDFLSCLEGCGVDNWCGWDDAQEMHESYGDGRVE